MTVFILFQTDPQKSRRSRTFHGVFSTKNNAIDTAKANDLYTSDSEVEIIEIEFDKFIEFV